MKILTEKSSLKKHFVNCYEITDAYEENTPRSCSSCNLAMRYTFLTVLVIFLFIYLSIFLRYTNDVGKIDTEGENTLSALLTKCDRVNA